MHTLAIFTVGYHVSRFTVPRTAPAAEKILQHHKRFLRPVFRGSIFEPTSETHRTHSRKHGRALQVPCAARRTGRGDAPGRARPGAPGAPGGSDAAGSRGAELASDLLLVMFHIASVAFERLM